MSKDYRESATAHIATAISDFPDIDNYELFQYLEWLGFNIEYESLVTIAAAVRTSFNINMKGHKRRKRLPVSNRRYISTVRKS
jgi:hypothetical protein